MIHRFPRALLATVVVLSAGGFTAHAGVISASLASTPTPAFVAVSVVGTLSAADSLAAARAVPLIVDKNVVLSRQTVLTAPRVFAQGGVITRGSNALTINGSFCANGAAFDAAGTGKVTFAGGTCTGDVQAVWLGMAHDGVADDSTPLEQSLTAADYATLGGVVRHYPVTLPPGDIRVTRNIIVKNANFDSYYTLRGAGQEATRIVGDFAVDHSGAALTLGNTGGGTGAILVPVTDNGMLTAVLITGGSTGSGYAGGTTITVSGCIVSPNVSLTMSEGAITGVVIASGGSGCNSVHDGDILTVRGAKVRLEDFTIAASARRRSAGNGGASAYPYAVYNNGLSFHPTGAFLSTQAQNSVARITISGQPGNCLVAARPEQLVLDQVSTTLCGADGVLLHDDRLNIGINNVVTDLRSYSNAYRGLAILQQINTRVSSAVLLANLTAGRLPPGVIEEAFTSGRGTHFVQLDIERREGDSGGKHLITMTDANHKVLGGYFRGGNRQIYLASAGAPEINGTQHQGVSAGDPTLSGVFFDSATSQPTISSVSGFGNITNLVSSDPAAMSPRGEPFPDEHAAAPRGRQFTSTQSTGFTPAPATNGRDQYLILTGNVAVANPSDGDVDGREFWLFLIQDGLGRHTPTFGTKYVLVDSIDSGRANQIMLLQFRCVVTGSRTIWLQTNKGASWN